MNRNKIIFKILHYINLDAELDDHDKIHSIIEKDILFKGTNLWILIFAIFVASVGLNMNSTAVIIGAMLISPLMGPINGVGYSIATYNFQLLNRSLKNYSFAIITGLITSTIYFSISPISTAHSELLARTSPTIYDVLIALFGGLAGIVAISSRNKGNVIPGVAIATALMPPLCTAGYGLATGQFSFFFGALYLLLINSVFIALAAMIVSQILKFPIRGFIDINKKKIINRWISVSLFLIIIPSIYFGYNLVQKEKFIENANLYVSNVSIIENNYLLKHDINPNNKSITLIYGGKTMSEEQIFNIIEKAKDFELKNTNIAFKQGLKFDDFDNRNTEVDLLKTELNKLSVLLEEKIDEIDSLKMCKFVGKELVDEISNIYPNIIECSFSQNYIFKKNTDKYRTYNIVVFVVDKEKPNEADHKKIKQWLKSRLKLNNIKIFYQLIEEND